MLRFLNPGALFGTAAIFGVGLCTMWWSFQLWALHQVVRDLVDHITALERWCRLDGGRARLHADCFESQTGRIYTPIPQHPRKAR